MYVRMSQRTVCPRQKCVVRCSGAAGSIERIKDRYTDDDEPVGPLRGSTHCWCVRSGKVCNIKSKYRCDVLVLSICSHEVFRLYSRFPSERRSPERQHHAPEKTFISRCLCILKQLIHRDGFSLKTKPRCVCHYSDILQTDQSADWWKITVWAELGLSDFTCSREAAVSCHLDVKIKVSASISLFPRLRCEAVMLVFNTGSWTFGFWRTSDVL